MRRRRPASVPEDGELALVAEALVGRFEIAGGAEGLDRSLGVVQKHGRAGAGEARGEEDALLAAGVVVAVALGAVDEDHVPVPAEDRLQISLRQRAGLDQAGADLRGVADAEPLAAELLDPLEPLGVVLQDERAAAGVGQDVQLGVVAGPEQEQAAGGAVQDLGRNAEVLGGRHVVAAGGDGLRERRGELGGGD